MERYFKSDFCICILLLFTWAKSLSNWLTGSAIQIGSCCMYFLFVNAFLGENTASSCLLRTYLLRGAIDQHRQPNDSRFWWVYIQQFNLCCSPGFKVKEMLLNLENGSPGIYATPLETGTSTCSIGPFIVPFALRDFWSQKARLRCGGIGHRHKADYTATKQWGDQMQKIRQNVWVEQNGAFWNKVLSTTWNYATGLGQWKITGR